MKLYELTDAYRVALEQLSEPSEDGQEDGQYQALLAGLDEAFDEKVLGIAKVIRSLEADVTAIASELERLQGRRRHLSGRIDWLNRYLLTEMEASGRDRVRGPTVTVSLAKAPPSCEVADVDAVPAEFRRVNVEADRKGILEHFRETGEIVPGTTVTTDRQYVRIS